MNQPDILDELEKNQVLYGGEIFEITDWAVIRFLNYHKRIKGYTVPKNPLKSIKAILRQSIQIKTHFPKIKLDTGEIKSGIYYYNDEKKLAFICLDNKILTIEKVTGCKWEEEFPSVLDYQHREPFRHPPEAKGKTVTIVPNRIEPQLRMPKIPNEFFISGKGMKMLLTNHSVHRFVERATNDLIAEDKIINNIKDIFDRSISIKFCKHHSVIRLLNNNFRSAKYYFDKQTGCTMISVENANKNKGGEVITTIEFHPDWKIDKDYTIL